MKKKVDVSFDAYKECLDQKLTAWSFWGQKMREQGLYVRLVCPDVGYEWALANAHAVTVSYGPFQTVDEAMQHCIEANFRLVHEDGEPCAFLPSLAEDNHDHIGKDEPAKVEIPLSEYRQALGYVSTAELYWFRMLHKHEIRLVGGSAWEKAGQVHSETFDTILETVQSAVQENFYIVCDDTCACITPRIDDTLAREELIPTVTNAAPADELKSATIAKLGDQAAGVEKAAGYRKASVNRAIQMLTESTSHAMKQAGKMLLYYYTLPRNEPEDCGHLPDGTAWVQYDGAKYYAADIDRAKSRHISPQNAQARKAGTNRPKDLADLISRLMEDANGGFPANVFYLEAAAEILGKYTMPDTVIEDGKVSGMPEEVINAIFTLHTLLKERMQ